MSIDFSVCKFWCLFGLFVWLMLNAGIIVFISGATKKSKEFEEDRFWQRWERRINNEKRKTNSNIR